ncbi:short chain dehydrogenase [Dyella nitratireducens]|uniref:Short chain dehydrogenase n=1 Tax=Dyella nitratireducens TaxID=1849580 RepID=A0ABQ1GKT0_9GAMM|nr:short chain dehydrogenase [Dyella nitratireducens]GGA45784.1 short chain dehydrogenase [Dyella nitratireducens]GLQ41362.1 short chain dehydrogenase [Dyella nitratireducens]
MVERRLRILLVGASGTLGRAVEAELASRHEVIAAGRNSGSLRVDLTDVASIQHTLQQAGELDAVISAAGSVTFAPLVDFKPAPYGESLHTKGIADKLMGQVNLALAARDYLRDGGSITLTTGILSEQPIVAGSSASLVNGAVEAFVRAAAIELPRGLRINVVSPNVLTEAMPAYAPFFRGFEPVSAARAALAFARSVEGAQTGQVYKVF